MIPEGHVSVTTAILICLGALGVFWGFALIPGLADALWMFLGLALLGGFIAINIMIWTEVFK